MCCCFSTYYYFVFISIYFIHCLFVWLLLLYRRIYINYTSVNLFENSLFKFYSCLFFFICSLILSIYWPAFMHLLVYCWCKSLTLQPLRKTTEAVSVCVRVSLCVSVCLSVGSHISETSEAIANTVNTVTASVTRMHHISFVWTLSEVIQQYASICR